MNMLKQNIKPEIGQSVFAIVTPSNKIIRARVSSIYDGRNEEISETCVCLVEDDGESHITSIENLFDHIPVLVREYILSFETVKIFE